MPSVTIDAGVLAAPTVGTSRSEIYGYVETLLDWSKLLEEPWVAIYMSERAADVLFEDGLYPLRDALKNLFAVNGVVEYDANTVGLIIDKLLQLTPSFETFFRVKDVLLDDITTQPDLFSIHTTCGLVSDLARCLILISILRSHCRNPVQDHHLIVKPCGNAGVVQVRALVHDFEHLRDDIDALPVPPEYFEGAVLTCHNFRELIVNIDENVVWQAAQDDIALRVAVQIALYKSRLSRGLEPEWENVPSFSFGESFFKLTQENCRGEALITKLLRAMIETLDALNLADVHALRENMGGGSPQIARDTDKAWRRDIDYEYHLHYWECENGSIEFASMGPHNDFSIPR